MPINIFEFKARTSGLNDLEQRLLQLNPTFGGKDHQIDTYFNVSEGRLKLREGEIENALIYYNREDAATSKLSNVLLYEHSPDKSLKEILTRINGVKVIVEKIRKIYFIDNIKFHFDRVNGLGTFIEVEAIDRDGGTEIEALKKQCDKYFTFFKLNESDYVDLSYSDLLLRQSVKTR